MEREIYCEPAQQLYRYQHYTEFGSKPAVLHLSLRMTAVVWFLAHIYMSQILPILLLLFGLQ